MFHRFHGPSTAITLKFVLVLCFRVFVTISSVLEIASHSNIKEAANDSVSTVNIATLLFERYAFIKALLVSRHGSLNILCNFVDSLIVSNDCNMNTLTRGNWLKISDCLRRFKVFNYLARVIGLAFKNIFLRVFIIFVACRIPISW